MQLPVVYIVNHSLRTRMKALFQATICFLPRIAYLFAVAAIMTAIFLVSSFMLGLWITLFLCDYSGAQAGTSTGMTVSQIISGFLVAMWLWRRRHKKSAWE